MIYGTNGYHLPIILVFYIPWHRPAWKLFIIPTNTEHSTIMRNEQLGFKQISRPPDGNY